MSKTENLTQITEKEIAIIKRAKAGDESAFSWIFHKYKHFVDSILYGYIKDWDEARDLTNIVFLKVHDKLSMFVTYESFGGWLRTLTNRVAIDYLRIKGNRRFTLGEDDVNITKSDSIEYSENEIVDHLLSTRILEILDKYPPNTQEAFKMFYIDNIPISLIATRLRIPVGTVKSILSRTRKKLQKQFNVQQQ